MNAFTRSASSIAETIAREAGYTCSIEGCEKPSRTRGWCAAHYDRWRNNGDPLKGRTPEGEPLRYFREVVLTYDGDECLIWPFTRIQTGYGQIGVGGKMKLVHREACQQRHGPPPSLRHHAAHNCGKGHLGCCNPLHLEWKTPAENEADKRLHGTSASGERCGQAKLTKAQVDSIRAAKGTKTLKQIAAEFGVHYSTISDIHRGKTWMQEAA